MKFRKIICTLLIASSVAMLSACHSGNSTTPITSTQPPPVGVPGPIPWNKGGFTNYMFSWLLDGTIGGFSSFPGFFGFSLLTTFISGKVLPSESAQVMAKLKEMDAKLDTILSDLKQSLALSDSILSMLDQFFQTYAKDSYANSYQAIETDTANISTKYKIYTIQEVFGSHNYTANDWEKIYAEAQTNCNNSDLLSTLDAKNVMSKKPQAVKKFDTVYGMFNSFSTSYIDLDEGAAAPFNKLKSNEADYITQLFNNIPSTNANFIDYINYYNYQTMIYRAKLLTAYQELYNMQLLQLAYHYACNAQIDVLNIQLPKTTGKTGYKDALTALNVTYNNNFIKLESNINDALTPITNKDLVDNINN